jgi:hypothetical protein
MGISNGHLESILSEYLPVPLVDLKCELKKTAYALSKDIYGYIGRKRRVS